MCIYVHIYVHIYVYMCVFILYIDMKSQVTYIQQHYLLTDGCYYPHLIKGKPQAPVPFLGQ